MDPHEISYIKHLIELFNSNKNKEFILKKVTTLLDLLLQKQMYNHLVYIVANFNDEMCSNEISHVYQKIALNCTKNDDHYEDKEPFMQSIVSFFIKSDQKQQLQEFLSVLKEADGFWYTKVIAFIK